jgi:hypothetical protein
LIWPVKLLLPAEYPVHSVKLVFGAETRFAKSRPIIYEERATSYKLSGAGDWRCDQRTCIVDCQQATSAAVRRFENNTVSRRADEDVSALNFQLFFGRRGAYTDVGIVAQYKRITLGHRRIGADSSGVGDAGRAVGVIGDECVFAFDCVGASRALTDERVAVSTGVCSTRGSAEEGIIKAGCIIYAGLNAKKRVAVTRRVVGTRLCPEERVPAAARVRQSRERAEERIERRSGVVLSYAPSKECVVVPVVFASPAFCPKKALKLPVVFALPAPNPKKALALPSVFDWPATVPKKALPLPLMLPLASKSLTLPQSR